ncbi:MAG TPA: DNA mismatch repair protein MutS [Rhizomicrobium sp.]|nr:DNA mismatch repair protein MutS [Rhizomicrobium sp.]
MNEHVVQEGSTPLMAQYLEIKAAHADYLLFYRMGDFYELFFGDAVKAAEALDIALTKRGKHLGDDIPMCGVPVHAAEHYLEKLIRKGFRVAVCEQVEDPAEAKRRGAKAVVRREVVRLVTPGTLTEDTLLEPRAANLLAALGASGDDFALAAADMSTGEFTAGAVTAADLAAELARLGPRELLVPERLLAEAAFAPTLKALAGALTPMPSVKFDSASGERALKSLYRVAALDGFGAFSRAELSAAGALVGYLELTQKGKLPALKPPARISERTFMGIDAATRRNLELVETLNGTRTGSLLACIDRTVTAGGARELAARLASPLTDVRAIRVRHDAVAFFLNESDLRRSVREDLRRVPDIARALARVSVGRSGPRDLAALRDGINAAQALGAKLAVFDDALKPSAGEAQEARERLQSGLTQTRALFERLEKCLIAEPPFLVRDGGYIAAGAHPPLDDVRSLRDESRKVIASLEARYREESGVSQLKIRHNGVLGYFIELTPQHAEKLQSARARELFRHRQTIGSAVRFSTDELATLAGRIAEAAEKALAIEKELFDAMVSDVLGVAGALSDIAGALAVFDAALALAELAQEQRYTRPRVDESLSFAIERGRHPVVEAALAAEHAGPFVPNDCDLSREGGQRLWLVTGPNMAGKSTFLRQNAVIAILAQMGSFVPAERARIGIVDRLFSRVGAADDLARGRSTFMVEMVETAAILNQATERSLVILDEIGRGTATFDGLAIAWASVEHLHETNRARALFATHYHELTALASRLDQLACVTMRVSEWNDAIVFLHEVAKGAADRSYGIHVAKLAGLPEAVVRRAEEVLRALEEGREGHKPLARIDDLPLFSVSAPVRMADGKASAVEAALREVLPDTLTPKAALDLVYALKAMLIKT